MTERLRWGVLITANIARLPSLTIFRTLTLESIKRVVPKSMNNFRTSISTGEYSIRPRFILLAWQHYNALHSAATRFQIVSQNDAVTDNGRPIHATSVSNDSAGARTGHAYFSNLGAGAHVI